MFTKRFFSLFLVLSLVFYSGCGGKKMPAGMPKLYPVTISVTQEDKPFADCLVSLRYPDSSLGTWAVGGRTEANGIAKLYTDGYPGAPAGKFKVVLIKQEDVGLKEREQADAAAASRIQVKIWSCVKPEYNDLAKTPLEVEITKSTKTLSVDAGPAVKIEQKFVP
jgi:hypothetical protein